MYLRLLGWYVLASSFVREAAAQYNYVGGVPLRTPGKCPNGTVYGNVTTVQNCCGIGQQWVHTPGGLSYCCQNGTNDCENEVDAGPKCAIPAWQLCDARGPGFCCEAEWVCFIEDNGTEVGCSSPGAVLSSGQTPAATIYGANTGPSDTVTATATSALSESTTSPITSVAASPTNGQASHASLSSGAKAGIGVGVAVAILVAVVALFFVLRRKRRPSIKPNEHEFSKAELHSESLKKVETHIAELDDTGTINETGTEEKPAEMEDQSKYAELEGEWRGHEAPPVDQKVDDFYHLDLSRRYPQIQLPPHIDYPFDKV